MALQLRLGLLPERWTRTRSTGLNHIARHGTNMKIRACDIPDARLLMRQKKWRY